MNLAYLPNTISLARIFLAGMVFYYINHGSWFMASVIFWLAILSDILDGFLARKLNVASNIGGLFDHGSDAIFVTLTTASLSYHGYAPHALAIIIPIAFLQYMLDSKTLSGQPLRASYLGRYNGIAYYLFAGFPIMQMVSGIVLIPFDWFIWVGWGLVVSTLISIIDRLATLLSSRLFDKQLPIGSREKNQPDSGIKDNKERVHDQ